MQERSASDKAEKGMYLSLFVVQDGRTKVNFFRRQINVTVYAHATYGETMLFDYTLEAGSAYKDKVLLACP